MPVKILDCTLRDGGHHTQWNFEPKLVKRYLRACALSGVDWIELGYRRPSQIESTGPWNQCSEIFLKEFGLNQNIQYAVMIDLKDFINIEIASHFCKAHESQVSMVRIATHYHHIDYLEKVSLELKSLGYIVAVNLMRSGQVQSSTLESALTKIQNNDSIDIVNFADSYGSMDEKQVTNLITQAQKTLSKPLGFHAHDNKQLALRNSLKAIKLGAKWIDATVSGMGKGPGNTAMEFLLVELKKYKHHQYHPQNLAQILKLDFYPMKSKLNWGSDLFSYLAAQKSIHPDDIDSFKEKL